MVYMYDECSWSRINVSYMCILENDNPTCDRTACKLQHVNLYSVSDLRVVRPIAYPRHHTTPKTTSTTTTTTTTTTTPPPTTTTPQPTTTTTPVMSTRTAGMCSIREMCLISY